MDDVMLTTVDNPWNPFTHFDEWSVFDVQHGYNTCSLLAKKAMYANRLNDEMNDFFIHEAMKEIVREDLRGIFMIVSPESCKARPFRPAEGI